MVREAKKRDFLRVLEQPLGCSSPKVDEDVGSDPGTTAGEISWGTEAGAGSIVPYVPLS